MALQIYISSKATSGPAIDQFLPLNSTMAAGDFIDVLYPYVSEFKTTKGDSRRLFLKARMEAAKIYKNEKKMLNEVPDEAVSFELQ